MHEEKSNGSMKEGNFQANNPLKLRLPAESHFLQMKLR